MAKNANENPDWVDVFVERGEGKDKGSIFVGINGKGYYVPRGKHTKVPPEVAEVLNHRSESIDAAEEYANQV